MCAPDGKSGCVGVEGLGHLRGGLRKLVLGLVMAALVAIAPAPLAAQAAPDIVVVLTDDLGVGFPLDRLPSLRALWIEGGMHFSEAWAETPLCCPNRATLLSGRHTRNHGVLNNGKAAVRGFDPRATIATAWKSAGYRTFYAGKYFNNPSVLADRTPAGWDYIAMLDSWVGATSSTWFVQGRPVTKPVHRDRFVRNKALSWLRTNAAGDQPFAMVVAPHAPHFAYGKRGTPWVVDYEARYASDPRCAGISPYRPPTYLSSRQPDGYPLHDSCRALLTVDDMVGSISAELTKQGRTNVVWVFTSDNGMSWGRDGFPLKNVPQATQMPLYFAGAGIAPGVSSAMVSSIDIGPTLADLAGATMPRADGLSFAAVLRGETDTFRDSVRHDHPLGGYGGGPVGDTGSWWAVRTREWLLVEWPAWRGSALYHRPSDPWETTNVASDRPDIVSQLRAMNP